MVFKAQQVKIKYVTSKIIAEVTNLKFKRHNLFIFLPLIRFSIVMPCYFAKPEYIFCNLIGFTNFPSGLSLAVNQMPTKRNSLALTKNCCPFFDPSLRFHEFSFEKHVIAVQTNLANGKTNFLESSQLEFS